MKQMQISAIDPDKCYPMNHRNMGHALILNNVADEFPGTNIDVKELVETYEILGFQVRVENNCSEMKMRELKRWLLTEEIHKDSNCVAITVICHGTDQGWLLDVDGEKGWMIEDFIGDLSIVGTLVGKPKLFFVQACRGRQRNVRVAASDLAEPERFAEQVTLPKKADMFIAFATVPGYVASAGDDEGSHYLQALATFLREQYTSRPLDRIYLMVKQYMTDIAKGHQCAEERNSLRYLLRFSEYQSGTVLRQVKMKHIKTHDTGLVYWNWTKFTVMPSTGDVVLWGKTSDKASPMLHVYKSSTTSWEKYRSKSIFCEHENCINILPVTIKNQELLAVSCTNCEKIKLYNMKYEETTTAFSSHYPGLMCHGDTGQIYFVHHIEGHPIMQLSCFDFNFGLNKTILPGMKQYHSICYIPKHRLIAANYNDPGMIRAVHCDTDKKAWELSGRVSGKECNPHGMLFSPDHDALLVADGENFRMLVISPQDGSIRQVIQLGLDTGVTWELCFHEKQIVAHHATFNKHKLSYFSLE